MRVPMSEAIRESAANAAELSEALAHARDLSRKHYKRAVVHIDRCQTTGRVNVNVREMAE